MERWTDDVGVEYVSCASLCVGDYGGAGIVGEANIRALEGSEGAFVESGAYGSRQLWLPATEANEECIRQLEKDYPLVDEAALSLVEIEWQNESWEGWVREDLLRLVEKEDADLRERLEGWKDGELRLWFERAAEVGNVCWETDYNSAHIRVERVVPTFLVLVRARERAEAAGMALEVGDTRTWTVFADWLEDEGCAALAGELRDCYYRW